jgi:DNA polymerase
MIDAMCDAPSWAASIPLRAAGYITDYYKKD